MSLKWIKTNIWWILLVLVMIAVASIRLRLLNMPLERDEGEYAYMGQLILQGIPPYESVYNMKFPGVYYMYAFFMAIFGQTTAGVHLGLIVVNLCSILLLFVLVKKMISQYAAIVASTVYGLLSVSVSFCGFAGHATHFVVLPAIAGTLFLYKAITENKTKHYILSGLLLGLTPIMKQPGVFFFIFGFVFLSILLFINRKLNIKANITRLALFTISGLVPVILLIVILKLYGVLDKFWFWTFEYASSYASQVPLNEAFPQLMMMVNYFFADFYLFFIIAGLGVITMFFHPALRKKSLILFLILFLVFSFISVCPGFYFREHYFITLLPAFSILFSIFVDWILNLPIKHKLFKYLKYSSYALFLVPVLLAIVTQKDYLFKGSPNEISRYYYWCNPFVESVEIAKYIKAHTGENDKIAIIGSEPQIFFYANRKSATGYIYTYSLMEIQKNSLKMQEEMIREIEAAHPTHLIYVHIANSWLAKENSQTRIFDWINPYLQQNKFYQVGIADITEKETLYQWDEMAVDYMPISDSFVQIFERKK
jgi:hypothetical protein